MTIKEEMFSRIAKVFKRHGGITIDTPTFELKEILSGKYGEESKLIYDLQDQGGELCSLRYDLTVPFARYVAMNPTIQYIKRYHIGKVYRRDQPALMKGRMREFYQCDFDIAGHYDPMLPDAEILKILVEILDELNIGNYSIKLNHRKILDGIFDVCGVPKEKFRTISSSIDKLDKLPWSDVKQEMVKEKGLNESLADKIGNYIIKKGGRDLLEELRSDKLLSKHEISLEGINDMEILYNYLECLDIHSKVSFDLSLARGIDYYTGLIYEAIFEPNTISNLCSNMKELQFDKIKNDYTGIGSIAAGGRYDDLVGIFSPKKKKVPCVGVSIGVERIFSILKFRLSTSTIKTNNTDVYVMEFGSGNKSPSMVKERLQICKELWNSGINTQFLYKIKPKFRQQFDAAEKDQIPIAVIFGQDEIANNQVRIKVLGQGEQNTGELVPRNEMISKILDILKKTSKNNSYIF
ncbi:histidine-tRNA ligase [Pneumocystis carinii B80]|uniref:Histidine--tRNA ligase, mitochondrial n=1 Tax=Pneumocystis carinii (strain B80) TaxID=1408658 RepID=A0A0W4ZQW7_PNEC8|nr:histidine-tRNA ligase [Pneumocystis carinii B80]KTW30755.1 histidine-tRNA ligase [Pneumocystis carinii B80]